MNKVMSERVARVFLCFLFVFVASIYISYGDKKESTVTNSDGRNEIVSPIVGSSRIELNAIKEFTKRPTRRIIAVPVKGVASSITQHGDKSLEKSVPF